LERFLKFYPPQLYGKPDSEEEVEVWVDQMKDIFVALSYEDQRKIQFATFRLRGPARDWWHQKKEVYEREQRVWIWVDFLTEFRDQFIPQYVVEKMEDEFQNLK
jgi:hypothetical protein